MARNLVHEAKMRRHFVSSITAEHADVQAVLDELNSRGPIVTPLEGMSATVVLTLSGARIVKSGGKPWRLHIVNGAWEIWVEPDPPTEEEDLELDEGEAAEDDHGD